MSLRSFTLLAHTVRAENRPAALVVAGRFVRSAIMREAVRLARQLALRSGLSWRRRMAIGLRTAWGRAKQERTDQARTAAALSRPTTPAQTPRSRLAPSLDRARVFISGSRFHSHGW
ncbi:hypothetical protein [uncultured Enterovirga sp.]|uniref:hypothetical protein n=1 Tax=uncultured Enterovirga sp. TaxID=2026352 RepID=UPI0035C994C8